MKPIDADQINRLSTALDKQAPQGATPLVGALVLAYAYLHQEAGGKCATPPCGAPGNRFVVLITDGVDSCPDPDFDNAPCGGSTAIPCTHYLLDTETDKAHKVNIRTFVIGAPGSELGRGFLSQLAFKGGTANNSGSCDHSNADGTTGNCHFDMTATSDFATDLSNALVSISGKAVGCEFSVPTTLDSSTDKGVNIQYTAGNQDPVCIRQDNSKACDQGANGWQYGVNPDGTPNLSKVVICGEPCDTIKNSSSIKVDVLVGCDTLK